MKEKELFIGIWQVPPATEENYKLLADCGMNAVFLNGDYTADMEDQKKAVFYCEKYGIDCITHAKKPFPKGIRQCLERYGVPNRECALAGDQIYTDTLGANSAGVTSILVKAIDNHNIWLKLRHVAELPFIFAARKRSVNL